MNPKDARTQKHYESQRHAKNLDCLSRVYDIVLHNPALVNYRRTVVAIGDGLIEMLFLGLENLLEVPVVLRYQNEKN